MATELWFPGVKPGWLSGLSLAEITVTAELDGIDIVYRGTDADVLKHAFFHAALRTVLRRFLPWIAPPIKHKNIDSSYLLGHNFRILRVVQMASTLTCQTLAAT